MICGVRKMTAPEEVARGCQKPEGGDTCAVLPGQGVPSLSGDCLAALGPATCRNGAEAVGGQSHGTCYSWNSEARVHFQCGPSRLYVCLPWSA